MPLDETRVYPAGTWLHGSKRLPLVPTSDDNTLVLPRLKAEDYTQIKMVDDPVKLRAVKNLAIIHDALSLVTELWPKPGYATVTLESHQWARLRRVLLALPELVATDE